MKKVWLLTHLPLILVCFVVLVSVVFAPQAQALGTFTWLGEPNLPGCNSVGLPDTRKAFGTLI
jgi:hypothetical protein